MQSHLRIGRVLGIEIGVHFSWFVIAFLLTLSLVAHFRAVEATWTGATVWTTAVLTSILFFVTLVLHELSHAVVARARGLPVGAITLFALGGVSRIERESEDPRTEFLIGIAGPATSLVVGVVCLGLAGLVGWRPEAIQMSPAQAVLSWLGYINFGLALFNLIPGFPLDGGRVLRAVLWSIIGDRARATLWAARLGQVVAFGLIFVGVFQFFTGANIGGLWLAFIGWFLLNAAGSSYRQVRALDELQGVRVSDVMSRDCAVVDHRMPLSEFVEGHLLRTGRRCFVVAQDGQVAGLVTPHEIRQVPRGQWEQVSVGQVMRPFRDLHTMGPDASVTDALSVMGNDDVHQIPVLDGGRRLVGVISRGDILSLLQTRAQLSRAM
jgi:Zn-dependent protease/predicted transcriptional regulator